MKARSLSTKEATFGTLPALLGTAEIQKLARAEHWRYVLSSEDNPADGISRGKNLVDLITPTRWACAPAFLCQPPANPALGFTSTPAGER